MIIKNIYALIIATIYIIGVYRVTNLYLYITAKSLKVDYYRIPLICIFFQLDRQYYFNFESFQIKRILQIKRIN